MFEMNRKDAMTFRTLPLKGLVGVTYYYDFTLMNRYVIFHSMSGIYAKYHVFDKATRIQRRILDSRILYCEKNHSLLIPFVMYALRNENGHPWSTKIQGNIEQQDLVNMIFRGVMPQLGFAIREEQIQMAKTMLEGLSKKKITLFEAGVGTGKTMGYLVAAFLVTRTETIYQYMQNPITIATSSIDLQRELVEKEIPKLSNALMRVGIIDRPLRVVVRKGKEHYFCVRRYFSLMRDLRQHPDKYQRQIDMLDAGAISGEVSPTLGINCGMSTGRNGILKLMAFTQNQRDEVRDLKEIAGALCTSPGTKQQTYVAGVVSKGDGTCFLTEDTHTSLTGGGGQAGQGYPCVLTYDPPELQDSSSILCLNDQGGQFMNISEGVTGTLRSQMAGHPPLVLESNQDHAVVREDGISPTLPAAMGMGGGYVPMVYENHGIDSRYTGPYEVSPTISARCGTGGNNLPLVDQPEEIFCIVGNVIDRQPENGGNGCGYQRDLAYTLTGMDRHAVYSRQRIVPYVQNIMEIEKGLVELRLQLDVASGKDKKLLKAKIKEAEESVEAMKIARKSMLKFQSSFETGLAVE